MRACHLGLVRIQIWTLRLAHVPGLRLISRLALLPKRLRPQLRTTIDFWDLLEVRLVLTRAGVGGSRILIDAGSANLCCTGEIPYDCSFSHA